MSAAEFALLCKTAGLTAAEIDEWNIGTVIDYIQLKNESAEKARDKSCYSRSTKYRQLKLLEPKIDERYRKGQISEEKYRRFKEFLREYE